MIADRTLHPMAFHVALASTLQKTEPGLWQWFAGDEYEKKYVENVKLELLRSTYRLPRASNERVYGLASEASAALGLEVPLTLYQAQASGNLNAGLIFLPQEAHVVLQGPVMETLNEAELCALFGHELAHHRLWTEANGAFHTADNLLEHIVRQQGCAQSHVQSALRHRRWTELYADRGSLVASGELAAAISCLLKVSTGLKEVDAKAYLAQAAEILETPLSESRGVTHPENFIRAWALSNWHTGGDEARLKTVVEGPMELETLDMVQQAELTSVTQQLIATVLQPGFMRTESTLTHARRFFPEASFDPPVTDHLPALPRGGASLDEYFAYLLLDFALADPELEDAGLAHAAQVARKLGLATVAKVARKELRMSAAAWEELERRVPHG